MQKWIQAQWNGPVRENPIQRTVSLFICVCIKLCTIVAHNIAQNRPDSFPPYPPDDHHSSDDVYLREGGGEINSKLLQYITQTLKSVVTDYSTLFITIILKRHECRFKSAIIWYNRNTLMCNLLLLNKTPICIRVKKWLNSQLASVLQVTLTE